MKLRVLFLGSVIAGVAFGCTSNEDIGTGSASVTERRVITVEGSNVRVATWEEGGASWFQIDLGQGAGWSAAKKTSYEVPLQRRRLDPSREAATASGLHIVQYIAQPLPAFWNAVTRAGGTVHQYLHGNAQLVRGSAAAMKRIAALSFVRAVTPFGAAEKLDPRLAVTESASVPVNIVLVDPVADRAVVDDRILAEGGTVTVSDPLSILVEATLPASAIGALAAMPQTQWIEEAQPIAHDYDIANQQGGAEFLEALPSASALPGYTGLGIRGHIIEGIDPRHPDFAATDYRTAPVAVDNASPDSHGMQTFGIVFSSGAGNARARGLLPNGQGFFTNSDAVFDAAEGSRASLVAKLIAEHKIMFQTASWGNGLTKTYSAKSAEMDALILQNDLPITQSQSNTGSQSSRPQAWAKNIISVGALYHYGTVALDDDKWNRSGSIGPAQDGSIKPDLCFYYDKTITTTIGGGYANDFGGTSGATPTVAGHVGLSIEMWTNGIFGNTLVPEVDGEALADFRFKNRPHATTTKALLINSAQQHTFSGEAHDKTRVHQGWGIPDLKSLYGRRSNMLVVNETDVLAPLATKTYSFVVPAGSTDLHATLVYADKEAAVAAAITRVNNLDLKVTAPDGTVYWGNNGLKAGMTSTPGGEHNVLDTVENVLLNAPAAGTWTIDVIADEINADTHLESPETDADFALVVSTPTL